MYDVTVLENKQESPDGFTLVVSYPKDFEFVAGQFVHLQVPVGDRPLRRSYTIASAPHEEHLHITIRTQLHGKVSPVLEKLQAGDSLKMFGPFGDFTRGDEKHSVFIAAGSGITPFVSYLRDAQHNNDDREVTLLYSNKKQEDMLYHTELVQLDVHEWFSYIPTLTQEQWSGRVGRFGLDDIKEFVDEDTVFYVCGSNLFVRSFTTHLTQLGVSVERIRLENYGNITA